MKAKDMVGIPWLVALALRADGWWLRSDVIWNKPNPMPESVNDRPTKSHEYVFLLAKSERYYYDAVAIREAGSHNSHGGGRYHEGRYSVASGRMDGGGADFANAKPAGLNGRNRRSVWTIATEPFPEAHFATFPQDLVKPCVLAGTSERGCCAQCGAPWERVLGGDSEESRTPPGWNAGPGNHRDLTGRFDNREYDGKRRAEAADAAGRRILLNIKAARDAGADHDQPFPPKRTVGWRPTCLCRNQRGRTVPAVVLDPFAGAGTALLVAAALGRRAVGAELNPTYAEMAARRQSPQEVLPLW